MDDGLLWGWTIYGQWMDDGCIMDVRLIKNRSTMEDLEMAMDKQCMDN